MSRTDETLTIGFVGALHKPDRSQRNRMLENGLEQLDYESIRIDCRNFFDRGSVIRALGSGQNPFLLALTLTYRVIAENLILSCQIVRRMRTFASLDVIFVPNHADYSIYSVYLFSRIFNKQIIFDHHNSLYFEFVHGRELIAESSLFASLIYHADRKAVDCADVYLVYSKSMQDTLCDLFDTNPAKMRCIYTGVNEDRFADVELDADRNVGLLYWGYFHSYHGLDVLTQALTELRVEVDVTFIGKGIHRTEPARIRNALESASNVNAEFIRSVSNQELGEYISSADLTLGVFTSNPLSNVATMNKYSEASYFGAPMITADSPVIQEVFTPGKNIITCEPDCPGDIAKTIESFYDGEFDKIGSSSRKVYDEKLSPRVTAKQFVNAVSTKA